MELVIILLIAVEVVIVRISNFTITRSLTCLRHLFVMDRNYGRCSLVKIKRVQNDTISTSRDILYLPYVTTITT